MIFSNLYKIRIKNITYLILLVFTVNLYSQEIEKTVGNAIPADIEIKGTVLDLEPIGNVVVFQKEKTMLS